MFALALTILTAAGPRQTPVEATQLYKLYPDAQFSPLFRESLETYVRAEEAYKAGRVEQCRGILVDFWAKHPPGTPAWGEAYRDAANASATTGINIGHPSCYYALRMLTECAEWQSRNEKPKDHASATLTVVLVGQAKGKEPRSRAELEAKKGIDFHHELDKQLLVDNHKIIRESTWLFLEYVKAATRGGLEVKIDYVFLPTLIANVETTWDGRGFSGMTGDSWTQMWKAIPAGKRRSTDWWWVLYPSAVPEQHPDFRTAEFVTGGMGTGPDGASPCFIIDDKWLTRKPPHIGRGAYTSLERRAYLPQWLQHEFFHHLYRIYPEYALEKTGHDWFDRTSWPRDFEGLLEPDYYHESLQKRFVSSEPSLTQRLLYAAPPAELLRQVDLDDVVGEFVHEPEQNEWHRGTIRRDGDALRWTNRAGATWTLTPDLGNGVLRTGPDCPYHGAPSAEAFTILLERDKQGRYLPKVKGFSFHGGVYRLAKS